MFEKMCVTLYGKYLSAKLKMEKLLKEEDGMETLETVILVVVAVALAAFILSALKGDDGLINTIFRKIEEKINGFFD